ncbi:MAG: hypothetical protein D6717_10925 [Gammaproteobacteria bacterium]|nr:MAG: hypothetical protein D6717_10925 [Gammaproteobacteria bacterium]
MNPSGESVPELTRREEIADCTRRLIQEARQEVAIVSRELDPGVYDQAEISDALLRLARTNHHARIRILIRDNRALVKASHRLQHLHQRLTSFLQIRRLGERDMGFNKAFLVVDRRNWLHQPLADRYEARASTEQPLRGRELQERFEELWTESREDPELRRLSL